MGRPAPVSKVSKDQDDKQQHDRNNDAFFCFLLVVVCFFFFFWLWCVFFSFFIVCCGCLPAAGVFSVAPAEVILQPVLALRDGFGLGTPWHCHLVRQPLAEVIGALANGAPSLSNSTIVLPPQDESL